MTCPDRPFAFSPSAARLQVERWLKTTFLLQDKKGVSVMPPDDYADRFEQRVIQAVIESNR